MFSVRKLAACVNPFYLSRITFFCMHIAPPPANSSLRLLIPNYLPPPLCIPCVKSVSMRLDNPVGTTAAAG